MAGFEDLIRSTLKKQGDISADRRAAIYQSSRDALNRMIAQNDKLDEAASKAQRDRLEEAIDRIENDYKRTEQLHEAEPPAPVVDASPPLSVEAPVVPPPVATPTQPTPKMSEPPWRNPEPEVDYSGQERRPAGPPPQPKLKEPAPAIENTNAAPLSATRGDSPKPVQAEEPVLSATGAAPSSNSDAQTLAAEPPAEYKGKAMREKRPFAKLLLWTIILAGIGTGIWWAVNFGPDLIKSKLSGAVENPQPRIETGSFVPEGEDGWISIFSPDANPESIDTGENGRAELVTVDGRQVARLASATSKNSTIKISIPPGVLETLRGKAATFEVVLAAETGQSQQFAIYCEFGQLGNCGRKRFRSRQAPEAYIFDVLINDASPGEGEQASIAINTDIASEGKILDLYSIRVRTGS